MTSNLCTCGHEKHLFKVIPFSHIDSKCVTKNCKCKKFTPQSPPTEHSSEQVAEGSIPSRTLNKGDVYTLCGDCQWKSKDNIILCGACYHISREQWANEEELRCLSDELVFLKSLKSDAKRFPTEEDWVSFVLDQLTNRKKKITARITALKEDK